MDRDLLFTFDRIQERHWWYASRRRILHAALEDLDRAGLPEGTLCDLGCGAGSNLPVLERFGETLGIDDAEDAVGMCHRRGYRNVRRQRVEQLAEEAPGSCKVVLLADVIEHIDDEDACLRAVHRLLAPGGALLITVPAYDWLWSPSDDLNEHRRRYTEPGLRTVVARHFEVERSTYFNTFLFGLVVAGRAVEKALHRRGDEAAEVPAEPVNSMLEAIFCAEIPLLRRARLPFGGSVLCVARRARDTAAGASNG